MDYTKLWFDQKASPYGAKLDTRRRLFDFVHNGQADIPALLNSEYGGEMAKLAELEFSFENDPMGEACLSYYAELGVRKEMYQPDDFFGRWTVFSPLEMPEQAKNGWKYPLIVWNHGGGHSLETTEFCTYISQHVGSFKCIVLMAQNTNYQNIKILLDFMAKKYPIDSERIYIGGFSQGGQAALSSAMRMPERFAAVSPNGNPIFRFFDNQAIRYTIEEALRFTEAFLPFLQVNGAFERGWYSPVNRFGVTTFPVPHELFLDPRMDMSLDPTRQASGGLPSEVMPGKIVEDKDRWKVDLLNARLATLGCAPRDVDRCLGYRDTPEDRLHHRTGFYGDKEETRLYFGNEHYTIDIFNKDEILALRYMVIENGPHNPSLKLGEIMWEFFRQYRRDSNTGKIVLDTYKAY